MDLFVSEFDSLDEMEKFLESQGTKIDSRWNRIPNESYLLKKVSSWV